MEHAKFGPIKLNVINYTHETHALAYTFKAGRFKCASAYIHAYNL